MLWIKTFHVLGVIAWLVGIFYLPRIFVHYAEGQSREEDVRRLIIMAGHLFVFMTIMAVAAILFGSILWLGYGISGSWLHIKLLFVFGLLLYHAACGVILRHIKSGRTLTKSVCFRVFNEISLLLVVPILVLAIVKP